MKIKDIDDYEIEKGLFVGCSVENNLIIGVVKKIRPKKGYVEVIHYVNGEEVTFSLKVGRNIIVLPAWMFEHSISYSKLLEASNRFKEW